MALQTKVLVATESPRMTRLGGALILTPSPFSHDLVFNAGANSFLEVSHRKAPGLGLPTMQVQPKVLCGVVVSAGRMMKAVKVQTAKQVYNSFLKKVGYLFACNARIYIQRLGKAYVDDGND